MVVSQIQTSNSAGLERVLSAAGVAAMSAASAAVWYFDPTKAGFLPACPLYTITGFACPGCGLTRGFHALFHGDIATALDFNALIPLFVLIFGLLFVSLAMVAVRGKGLIRLDHSPKFLVGFFALLIIFGVLRNLPFYPFSILFPSEKLATNYTNVTNRENPIRDHVS